MTEMPTTLLRSGNEMPVLGLGTWKLTDHTADTIAEALTLGYRLIDTSGDYGTQPGIGAGMRKSGVPRDDVFVVTKVEENEDAYEAARRNIAEIGLEYADMILLHRPPEDGAGVSLWEGLIRFQEEGLARDIGVSNYAQEQIDALIEATGHVPAVNQIEWSPFGHSPQMLSYAAGKDMVIQAYSPMTRGQRLDDPALREIAARCAKTPAQVILRWNIQRGVVPLPKANHRGHLEENLGALDFTLSEGDMSALDRLNERYSALGELPYT